MRLLDCRLQNVRLHADLALSFSPRLTLIGGANETGKSTLVEALHRALFLKATATGASVSALQSRLHLGHPSVDLRFEARDDTWTLRKRFSGAGGQVSLRGENTSQPLTGPVAEELLAELLGVSKTLGGHQATSALPSRWAHLWVMQGSAGHNPIASGTSHYDFDQLRQQLEQSGGAAVQQSALDQLVQSRIDEALAENFNSRGVRKNSPLGQRSTELADARQALAAALGRLDEYEQANNDLAAIIETLEQAQQRELPALQERRALVSQGAEASGRLDGAISLAHQTLEPIRLRQAEASKALEELDALVADIAAREKALAELQQTRDGAVEQERSLAERLQQHSDSRSRLKAQRQDLEQRLAFVSRSLEAARSRDTLARLESDLEQQRQAAERRQSLEQQLANLPVIRRADITALRDRLQRQRDLRTRMEAMAAGVTLLRADQSVRLNGDPLQIHEERRLSSVFSLQVGEGVELEIRPGGGQAMDQLDEQLRASDGEVQQQLQALAVASLEQAEQRLEQRSMLEQQLAALAPASAAEAGVADEQRLGEQRKELLRRLAELEAECAGLQAIADAMALERPLPSDPEGLQGLHQELSRTLHQCGAALQQAEAEQEQAQTDLQAFQKQQLDAAAALQTNQAQLEDRRGRLDGLLQSQGSRDGLMERLSALTAQRQQAETDLQRLQAERAQLAGADPVAELAGLDQQIEAVTRRIEQLLDQRGAAKQRCEAISGDDPYASAERARVQLEAAAADHQSLLRLTQAQEQLQALFQEAQADLSSRYSEPLAQSIGSYLRPLIPDGPVAQLEYDATTGFRGLQLRRGAEFYPFEQLSGGMREQLAAALRLSMADVLKGGHDGCLPLVFDDAFTNSDPARVDLVKTMLSTAVERGLQVILLTCDPQAYAGFADQVEML